MLLANFMGVTMQKLHIAVRVLAIVMCAISQQWVLVAVLFLLP